MRRLLRQYFLHISILAISFIAMFACQLTSIEKEKVISQKDASYTINPSTILDSLQRGEINVFTLQNTLPDEEHSVFDKPVEWSQSDYYLIAESLHNHVWGESLDTWILNVISFDVSCKEIEYGPQKVSYKFYKVIDSIEGKSRIVHDIFIIPREGLVLWNEFEYYPQVEDRDDLDLKLVNISMLEILSIAEASGGYQTRSIAYNNCEISAVIPVWDFRGWNVRYRSNDITLLETNIDRLTGEYQLVKPKVK